MKTVTKIIFAVLGGLLLLRLLQICGEACCRKLDRRYISREID